MIIFSDISATACGQNFHKMCFLVPKSDQKNFFCIFSSIVPHNDPNGGGPGKDDPKHPSRSNPLHASAAHKASSSYVDDFTKTV